jgi:hypothetical protein
VTGQTAASRPAQHRSAAPPARLIALPVARGAHRRASLGRYVLVLGVVVAAGIVAGLVLGAPRTPSPPPPPLTTPTASSVRAAAQWVTADLPVGARVVADAGVAQTLAGAGFDHVTDSAAGWRQDRFVVVTSELRARAATDAALARCLTASLAVARFGRGPDFTEVRQITTDLGAAARARRAGYTDRRRGGAALAGNHAITMSAHVRAQLRAGLLDKRAQAVLAALARREPFRLQAIDAVPAETAVGMPARTVYVEPSKPARFRSLLAGLPGTIRPAAPVRAADGAERLTWPVRPPTG